MAFRFRKSVKVGPFRLTATKSGLTASAGVRGARVSANSKGQVRRTFGVPGTGVYDTKVVGGGDRSRPGKSTPRPPANQAGYTQTTVESQVHDATNGRRDLLFGDPTVTRLKVVGASGKFAETAALAGITRNSEGWTRAIRSALLVPAGADDYHVVVMIYPTDNPALFAGTCSGNPKGTPFGRLGKTDARRWAEKFAGRTIQVVIYIDATTGLESAEVRFFADALEANGSTIADAESG